MRPSSHLILSASVGAAVWAATSEPLALPITIGTGILVDIDHLPDMVWHHFFKKQATASFVLHSWEWLIGLFCLGIVVWFHWWIIAVIAGYASHIMTDQLFNKPKLLSYSFIFRATKAFKFRCIFPNGRLEHPRDAFLQEISFKSFKIN